MKRTVQGARDTGHGKYRQRGKAGAITKAPFDTAPFDPSTGSGLRVYDRTGENTKEEGGVLS
jgi:hypothetical protein